MHASSFIILYSAMVAMDQTLKSVPVRRPHLKSQRLDRFRRIVPHVSASALAHILQEVKEQPDVLECGISTGSFRMQLQRERDRVSAADTPYGKLLQQIFVTAHDGTSKTLEVQHPMAMLWYATKNCVPFADFMDKMMDRQPSSPAHPWKLAMYSDEVTPGDALQVQNTRKLQASCA